MALDGFPIYGDRALNGSKISVDQLDACNGITSATPEFPQGIYHYVLPDIKDANSSIRCFTGKVSKSMSNFIQQHRMPRGVDHNYYKQVDKAADNSLAV